MIYVQPSENFKIEFKWVDPVKLSSSDQKESKEYFVELKKSIPKMFDAPKISCQSLAYSSSKVTFNICRCEYRDYVWSRGKGKHLSGLAPIGSGVLFNDNNFYYLVKRSASVQYGQDKISLIGGNLDYFEGIEKQNSKYFENYIKSHILQEIKEEVDLSKDIDIESLNKISYVFDTEFNKLQVQCLFKGKLEKLKEWENSEIIKVPINDFVSFIKENSDKIQKNIIPSFKSFLLN